MDFIAYAQDAGQGAAGAGPAAWMNLLPFALIMVIFYFLLIRPQQKKEKERKKMISQLQRNDKIVTVGGIHGVIVNVRDGEDTVTIKTADNTKIEMSRSSVQSKVMPKSEGEKTASKK